MEMVDLTFENNQKSSDKLYISNITLFPNYNKFCDNF